MFPGWNKVADWSFCGCLSNKHELMSNKFIPISQGPNREH